MSGTADRRSGFRFRAVRSVLLAVGCLMSAPAWSAPQDVVIRVDPRGSDHAAAAPAAIVATLPQAADLVARWRARRSDLRVTIEVAPGTHRLDRAVRLGPEHGGAPHAPLVIRGAAGATPRVVGSVRVSADPMGIAPDALARLPAEARPHVRVYRLPPAALASPRIETPRLLRSAPTPLGLEVYDRSGALAPARWPNEEWAQIARGPASGEPSFEVGNGRVQRWRGEPDLWAEGYWRWGWLFEALPVTGIDAARPRLTLQGAPYEGILAGARFRVYHALSELDRPGEWWRDAARGLLVVWPRDTADDLEVAVAESLFRLEGASHVRIEGLRLEQARGDLVVVRGGRDVVIAKSSLAWSGGRAAVFEGAAASGLVDCDIADIGRAGVRLSGGDRASLTPGGLFLRDTRLTRYARISRTQSPAVEVDGVGATIAGNFIHDTNEYAIHLRGNDHVVEWNEIARLLADATDTGAVYAGRDWTARGSIVRHNFIHDVRAGEGREVKGVYLDDMASGFTVHGNFFLRVDQPVFIGGGRDNLVESNLFVASSPAIHIDARGETSARNAVLDPASEIRAALAAMPTESPLWRKRYPRLAGILSDAPGTAKGNRIVGNVFVESRPFRFDDGGKANLQTMEANVGPDGIRAASGADLAALAARSVRPSDFENLIAADGRPLPRIAVSRMRRSILLEGFSAR